MWEWDLSQMSTFGPYVALFWFSWNNPDLFTPQHPSTPEVHMTYTSVPYQERKKKTCIATRIWRDAETEVSCEFDWLTIKDGALALPSQSPTPIPGHPSTPMSSCFPLSSLNVEFYTIIWHQCKFIMCQKDKKEQGIQRSLCENSQDVCEARSKSLQRAAVLPGRAAVPMQAPPHGRGLYGGSESNGWVWKSTSESYIIHVRMFLNSLIHISCILSTYVQSCTWWKPVSQQNKIMSKENSKAWLKFNLLFLFSPLHNK